MGDPTQPRRRRFRFSLRLLLATIAVLSLGLGWFGAQLRWVHQRQAALRWILPLHARQAAATSGRPIPSNKGYYVKNDGTKAPWSLALFGEHGVERIEVGQQLSNASDGYGIDELRSLFPEAEIVMREKSDAN